MKQKARLTVDDRINLQAAISKGLEMSQIAKLLKKNRSTIYRELRTYYSIKDGKHNCEHCANKDGCPSKSKLRSQKQEPICFKADICFRLSKFPYVCNNCENKEKCNREKRYYDCIKAENRSLRNRIGTRKRKRISADDISYIDSVVSPLILNGLSLHHIYQSNETLQAICSERTIRRLVYDRYLEAKAHDLIRYASFKHSKQYLAHNDKYVKNIERLYRRTFTDLQKHLRYHKDIAPVQFDSVIGKLADKRAILTITFPRERFQFGLLIQKSSPESVYSRLHQLFNRLGSKRTKEIFPVLLADNGVEFSTFHNLEKFNLKVYFTNPYRSTDKAACERNHEFIRYIIPKGKTLDGLTQGDIDLMFSHINSYVRESNKNKTPFELIKERFGSEFLELIGIEYVEPNDVILKPKLLKK